MKLGNSLQVTWIRNTLIQALRAASSVSVHEVPSNFVYAHPTIAALAAFVSGLIAGKAVDQEADRAAGVERMRALLDKYYTLTDESIVYRVAMSA